jgi:hypothetical protein
MRAKYAVQLKTPQPWEGRGADFASNAGGLNTERLADAGMSTKALYAYLEFHVKRAVNFASGSKQFEFGDLKSGYNRLRWARQGPFLCKVTGRVFRRL